MNRKNIRNNFMSTVCFQLVANVYYHLGNFLLILIERRRSLALVERLAKNFTINRTLLAELTALSIIVSSDRFTAKGHSLAMQKIFDIQKAVEQTYLAKNRRLVNLLLHAAATSTHFLDIITFLQYK
ncbi:hypothetical protein BY458DRAFT_549778 [Sporodiniella umbellata]|nr:hypothetical protein BY458DRAFT_549778 [Sporodiniella umbellata]